MGKPNLSETMQRALTDMKRTRGFHFYGNHGIGENTLDALYRRGLIRYEQRMCPTLKFERACAALTDAGLVA